jgi:hypothetical protein
MLCIQTNTLHSNEYSTFKRMLYIQTNALHSNECSTFKRMLYIQTNALHSNECSTFKRMLCIQTNALHSKIKPPQNNWFLYYSWCIRVWMTIPQQILFLIKINAYKTTHVWKRKEKNIARYISRYISLNNALIATFSQRGDWYTTNFDCFNILTA